MARRFNLDPITQEWQSDYSVFANNPISISDPTGYDETPCDACPDVNPSGGGFGNDILNGLKDASNFIAGVGNSVSSNLLWQPKNLYNSDKIVDDRTRNKYKSGEKFGEVVSLFISAIEIIAGEGMVGLGGVFALPTGGLSLSVSAAGAGLMVHGAGSASVASSKLINNAIVESRSNENKGTAKNPRLGDKLETPDSDPNRFIKKEETKYVHIKTKQIYVKSNTSHKNIGNKGTQWKIWPSTTKKLTKTKERITLDNNGVVIGN